MTRKIKRKFNKIDYVRMPVWGHPFLFGSVDQFAFFSFDRHRRSFMMTGALGFSVCWET
jgi:hypothetical protein